jgi:hypothetical protein
VICGYDPGGCGAERSGWLTAVSIASGRFLNACRKHGCYKIMLQSNSSRTDAHAFYRAIGFDQDVKKAFAITNQPSC